MAKDPELSIVILSFNTKDLLKECLFSIERIQYGVNFEVIVVDNGSSDGTLEMLKKRFSWVRIIKNTKNLGFARGNNSARDFCRGEFVLFLNSDVVVDKDTLRQTVDYLKKNERIGALTCKIVLLDGSLDKDARRSFPTPWVSFTHMIGLDRIFPKSKLFSKYWYGYIPENREHEIDVIQGAFFLLRKRILDAVGWFDEDYFLDGEDVDLSWKIKQLGRKMVYYPKVSITHIKGASKGKGKTAIRKMSLREKLKLRMSGVTSMEIFYRKRLWKRYPLILNLLVISSIKFIKTLRFLKTVLS